MAAPGPHAEAVAPAASFDSLRAVIHQRFDHLSPHLQRIATLALDDPNGFALATVAAVAEQARVQPSSVIRFAKQLGYRGFSDLQRVFKVRLVEGAPSRRERILDRQQQAHRPGDPLAVLHDCADANIHYLERLKAAIAGEDLARALVMLQEARSIHVIGLRRAFPLAAYMFYGLIRSERRCQLLDAVGGMVPQQVATMGASDLLVAIAFAEYAPLTVEVVQDAHIRGIPTLAITDSELSPLARNASLAFLIEDLAAHRFRPLSAAMCLIQTLIVGLGDPPRAPQANQLSI
jgi:DNA-binding MurR/RpiR family transcriptional regulator